MKYSFVIPTYNNRVLLKNTLEALNYQPGYGYYEVIVVDDGSTDNSGEYIKGVNRNYDLKYFYLEGAKIHAGPNAGIMAWSSQQVK